MNKRNKARIAILEEELRLLRSDLTMLAAMKTKEYNLDHIIQPGYVPTQQEPSIEELKANAKGPGLWYENKLKWLEEAEAATKASERRDYEHPLLNLCRTCIKWSVDANTQISPKTAALMMIDLKGVRDLGKFKEDNWIDIMGYSELVEQMDQKMKELGYSGVEALDMMFIGDYWNIIQRLTDINYVLTHSDI